MRKLFLLLCLFIGHYAGGQVLQKPTVYGYEFERLVNNKLLSLPADTFPVPVSLRAYKFWASKNNALYYWTGLKWDLSAAGSGVFADSLRRVGLSVQMRKGGVWSEQYTDSVGGGATHTLQVGLIDSLNKAGDGAQFNGGRLFMQTFDAEFPGLTPAGGDVAKANISDMLNIDTTGVQDGDVATWDAANDKVIFAAPTGGSSTDSTWHISFKTGVTTYAPAVGDSLFKHTYLNEKVINVYREGKRQAYDDSVGFEYSVADTTIIFHPVLASNERIDIILRDSARQRWLTLQSFVTPTLQDLDWENYDISVYESPANTWNIPFSKRTASTDGLVSDGYIQFPITPTSFVFGLDATSALEHYATGTIANYDYMFYTYLGNMYVGILGQDLACPTSKGAIGSITHVRIERSGTIMYIKTSTNGITFTTLHTFSGYNSSTLYPKTYNQSGSSWSIVNAKKYGF